MVCADNERALVCCLSVYYDKTDLILSSYLYKD